MSKYGETAQQKISKIIQQSERNEHEVDNTLARMKATAVGIYEAQNDGNIEELQGE